MKRRIYALFCFIILSQSLVGRTEMTKAKYACNLVELAIWSELLTEGKSLPSSWEDIPSFREKRKNLSAQNPGTLAQINSLAIVPSAPLVRHEQGISREISGRRLFAISRTDDVYDQEINNTPASRGRYVIFVTVNNSEISSKWIGEVEAQIILKQLENFDPEIQPLAFENVDQLVREKKAQQDRSRQEIGRQLRQKGEIGSDGQIKPQILNFKWWKHYSPLWLIGCILFGAILITLIFKNSSRH